MWPTPFLSPSPIPHPRLSLSLSLSLSPSLSSVCNFSKDRLNDRHSCLNLYPCVIKFNQSINQSINLCLCLSLSVSVSLPLCLCLSLCLCVSASLPLCLCLSVCLSLSLSLSLLSLSLSVCLSLSGIRLFLCNKVQSINQSIWSPWCTAETEAGVVTQPSLGGFAGVSVS